MRIEVPAQRNLFKQKEPAALTHGKFIQKLWGWEEIVANYPVEAGPLKYDTMKILTGQIVTLPQYVGHRFWAQEEPAVFVEASTHDDPKDSIRIEKAGPKCWVERDQANVRTTH